MNRPPPSEVPNIQEAATNLDLTTDIPARREIIQAVNSLKSGKAPGHDNLNVELLKANPELAATILTPLFTKIWEQEEIPSDWSRGVIIKIPKKGSLSDCNNWRGITLLSVPSKIFYKVIIQRITRAVDDIRRNEEAGFPRGAVVGIKSSHYGIYLSNVLRGIGSCDYEKEFDSIQRDSLWQMAFHNALSISNFTLCCVGQGDIS